MPIAYWCVLLAGLMPVLTVAIAKYGRPDYDNREPRAWMDKLEGKRRRADYAHRNHFEAFPFFAAGVIIAQQLSAPQNAINLLALGFITARIAYTFCYLKDYNLWRSSVWAVGYLCVIGLFLLAGFRV
ncbi:MAG: MAPEG family protein [Oxalobacteraceae bacterium]